MKSRRKRCEEIVAVVEAGLLAAALIGFAPDRAAAAPGDYKFTELAKLGEQAPGGGQFDLDFEPYSINAAGNVAFVADLMAGGTDIGEGVFATRSGKLLQIMGPGQPAPGGGTFVSVAGGGVLGLTPLDNAGDGAFTYYVQLDDGVGLGLYRFSLVRPTPSPVVIPGVTPAPTGGNFFGAYQSAALNNRGDLVFSGLAPGLQQSGGPGVDGYAVGLFMADARNKITKVAVPGDPAPGGKVFDDAWQGWPNNRGTIGFEGHVSGDECIDLGGSGYVCGSSVYERSADGKIVSIAHQGDPAPGGGTYRLAFGAVVNDPDTLVFIGDLTSPPDIFQSLGVFVYSEGTTTAVAIPGDPMPGGGILVTASAYPYTARLNNRGEIAFVGRLNTDTSGNGVDDTGLYVRSQGQLHLVARTGTEIPGVGTIAQINNPLLADVSGAYMADDPAINNSGQILFEAVLDDGSAVLLVASPKDAQ